MPRFFTTAATILLCVALASMADAQLSKKGLPRVPTPKYPGQCVVGLVMCRNTLYLDRRIDLID